MLLWNRCLLRFFIKQQTRPNLQISRNDAGRISTVFQIETTNHIFSAQLPQLFQKQRINAMGD